MKNLQKLAFVSGVVFVLHTIGGRQALAAGDSNAPPPLSITGTVFSPSGAPAPGVVVSVEPSIVDPKTQIKTDANGKFTVTWEPNQMLMGRRPIWHSLFAADPEKNLVGADGIDPTTSHLDLHLETGLTISTKIQDAAGQPITNAVAVVGKNPGLSANSDAEGHMRIGPLMRGYPYLLLIDASGFTQAQLNLTAEDTRAERKDLPAIVLQPANLKIAGQVLGADGEPVARARVFLKPPGASQPTSNLLTDDTGHFSFAASAGQFDLIANSETGFQAQGGDTNVVIHLKEPMKRKPLATITGTIFDPSGAPVPGIALSVEPDEFFTQGNKTDANGKFTIGRYVVPGQFTESGFSPDSHSIVVRDLARHLAAAVEFDERTTNSWASHPERGLRWSPSESEVQAANTSNVEVRLQPAFVLSGSVQDHDGRTLSNATVNLYLQTSDMGIGMGSVVTGQGVFNFSVLPPGKNYQLHATAPGFAAIYFPVESNRTQTAALQLAPIKLPSADRPLEGTVLGPDGQPIQGIGVHIIGTNQPSLNTRTDAKGHFAFKLCEGSVEVVANQPHVAGVPSFSAQAKAQAGDLNVVVKFAPPPAPQPVRARNPIPDLR